ncbi:MAG: hypothetical protein LDL33_07575 [Desulfomonile sp.]|nr:hypothetical protein [Desulfomonile sp.]
MRIRALLLAICLVAAVSPAFGRGDYAAEAERSAHWIAVLHEENSLRASLLFIPKLFLSMPVRIIGAIRNPKPTTQATMPPQGHQLH